jgi:hypothetical protein
MLAPEGYLAGPKLNHFLEQVYFISSGLYSDLCFGLEVHHTGV